MTCNNNGSNFKNPTYDLNHIKKLLSNPTTRHITRPVFSAAFGLGYVGEQEIIDRALLVTSDEFYKTMPSDKIPELMQDVYHSKTAKDKHELYIKFQIGKTGLGVLIQLKKK